MRERKRYIEKKGREKKDGLPLIVLSQRMMRFPHGEMAGERIYPMVRGFTTSRERQRKCTQASSHNTHTQPFRFLQGAAEAVRSQQALHGSMTYFKTIFSLLVIVNNPSRSL